MSPEPTAAISKGITTGFNEIIMQMHGQNAMALHNFDLISVIFFAHPNLSKLICGSHMNMIHNNFCMFLKPNTSKFIRHKILDLFFHLVFKNNEIIVNIPNFCHSFNNMIVSHLHLR